MIPGGGTMQKIKDFGFATPTPGFVGYLSSSELAKHHLQATHSENKVER